MDDREVPTAAAAFAANLVNASMLEALALRNAGKNATKFTRAPVPVPVEDRVRGWLKHMWTKATTDDDWSEAGPGPHPWWDGKSGPPMTSFPRFDLHEASYPLLLLAERTPAWREVYSTILNRLTARYITFWGAVDWLSQIGEDPNRKDYPGWWKGTLVPSELFGRYDAPGWTGNGVGPKGVEPDPIAADAMLFYKGFLTMLMAITERVAGPEARAPCEEASPAAPASLISHGGWDLEASPWKMAGVGGSEQTWTLSSMAAQLHMQWKARDCGLH